MERQKYEYDAYGQKSMFDAYESKRRIETTAKISDIDKKIAEKQGIIEGEEGQVCITLTIIIFAA